MQRFFTSSNPATFFDRVPNEVTRSIIYPMLFTPALDPKKPVFIPATLFSFFAGMGNDAAAQEIRSAFGYSYSLERILFQAIIDDHREIVKMILDNNPGFLLRKRENDLIIQSQYTWQIFKFRANESPLAIAAKRKQIEIIKLLLPYYEKLAQNVELKEATSQAKIAGLNEWPSKMIIPTEYANYINQLINVFSKEIIAPGTTNFTQLSAETEGAMSLFLSRLIPNTALTLDNHIDVELLLLAAYKLYNKRHHDFRNWEQRDAFCIRVIGLIQSVLLPETAKVLSVEFPNLRDGKPFYREDRESLSGLGGVYIAVRALSVGASRSIYGHSSLNDFSKLMSNKKTQFASLIKSYLSTYTPDHRCVIS